MKKKNWNNVYLDNMLFYIENAEKATKKLIKLLLLQQNWRI